jgi:Skp family chaperone for outer membrane proteins
MKKLITIICIFLFSIISISAQVKKGSREKIKAIKASYLTEQLNLSSEEAEKFWPIYNEYNKNQHAIRNELRTELKPNFKIGIDSISEEKAEKLVALKINISKKIYESDIDFLAKIKKVLPFKKILKLQIAEMEFGRKLMHRYKGKRAN